MITASVGHYTCFDCGRTLAASSPQVECGCGGALDLPLLAPPRRGDGDRFPVARTSVAEWALRRASLGALSTPLVRWTEQQNVWLKCDHLMPSGSFKDRGAQVMVARALELQFDEVVVDSSGNAAAALAAHAARAGLKCSVFVPLATSANKIRQIEAYGASVHLVPGPRDQSRRAAETYATQRGAMYASHAQNPYFLDGTKSWFYEVVAAIPSVETVVLPVGNGSLLLGVIRAVHELLASGWIRRAPALVLAQAEGYASLNGVHSFDGVSEQHPLAEGIAIRNPPRRAQMLELLSTFDASVRVLESQEVLVAQQELARGGFYVEPTSAAAWAAWRAVENTGETVVALTGHGLKTAA